MFLCSLHKGITVKSESSCYLLKVLALGQKLVLGKPSSCTQVGEVVSPPTSPLCTYLKIHRMRSTIFMINICIYNHSFKVFMNRKYEGVEDLVFGNVEDFSCEHGFDEVFMK